MKYIIGGSTGLLKDVDTKNRSTTRLTDVNEQSLDKKVTCLCWSGGYGGYSEDEITVGHENGDIISYSYSSMLEVRSFTLPSKCIYLRMLNKHFDTLGSEIYKKNLGSPLYPKYKDSRIYKGHDRILLAVCESGYIYLLDWGASGILNKKGYIKDLITGNYTDEQFVDAVGVYKYKPSLKCAYSHSLMTNRIVVAGSDVPPMLFDLFTESVLWVGKQPHVTLLDLKSNLDINCVCFLESIDPNVICTSTSNSFLYIYDANVQRDPVYDFNICDDRSKGYSKLLLSFSHFSDTNAKHRKLLKSTINQNYSADQRNLISLATESLYDINVNLLNPSANNPSYTPITASGDRLNIDGGGFQDSSEKSGTTSGNINGMGGNNSRDGSKPPPCDMCDLYLGDNVGSIYHVRVVTGESLVQWIYNKVCRARNEVAYINASDMTDDKKNEINQHLLNARKSLLTTSSNDHNLHYAKGTWKQYICVLKSTFNYHHGAVTHLRLMNNYLLSTSLDRFTNVVNLKSKRDVFHLYCNQKLTFALVCHPDTITDDDFWENKQEDTGEDNEELEENTLSDYLEEDLGDDEDYDADDNDEEDGEFDEDLNEFDNDKIDVTI